jgi:hypothetical protein
MRWCCAGFQGHFQIAGLRGFSIFVSRNNTLEPVFVLQHRSMDPDSVAPFTENPISLISEMYINYCPWCGVDLKMYYSDTYKNMDRSDLKI